MKVFAGILFLIIAPIICAMLAPSLYEERIERDLGQKVTDILKKHGLNPSGLEINKHQLTKLGEFPASDDLREKLSDDLDGVIGLYVDLDAIAPPPPPLKPPSFHLAEQDDQSVILTGLIRDESERSFLVDLAARPARDGGSRRAVDDQLELTDEVAPIEPKEKLSKLTPALLSSAEEGFVRWSPAELVIGGLLENKDEESTLLAEASDLTAEGASPLNKMKIQAFQDPDFGLERNEISIVATGLLPDAKTRDDLLHLVRLEAKGSRVIDKTSLAVRPRQHWWAKTPETFVPDFLAKTAGPARIHYYHDRFVAEGTFLEESDYKIAQQKIAQLPSKMKRAANLNFVRKPEPEPEPEPEPMVTPESQPSDAVAAENLVKELKGMAVYFASASSYIKKSEDDKITAAAQLILESKDVTQGLTVGGFADLRGNANFNRSLSLERANAVRDRLISKGVPAERLTVNHFGEDTSQTAKKDLWKSRRVEISLTKIADQ